MKWRIFFYFIIIGSSGVFGQDYRFRKITTADGLSQNSVNDIYQDSTGNIWLATQDGLNLFDGDRFYHFRFTGNNSPVQDNFIIQVIEDGKNNLWLTHRKGVTVFSKKDRSGYLIKPLSDLSYQPIQSIAAIQGNIMMITQSARLFTTLQSKSGLFSTKEVEIPVEFGKPFSLFELSGVPYLVCDNGLVSNFQDKQRQKFTPFPSPVVTLGMLDYGAVQDVKGNIWFTCEYELFKYTISNNQRTQIPVNPDKKLLYTDLKLDVTGNLWIATDDGIFIMDGETNQIKHHIRYNPENPQGLSYGLVHDLFIDKQNQMWVGTANEGVHVHNPKTDQFRFINQFHGLHDPTIWSIFQDSVQLLLGTTSGLEIITLKHSRIDPGEFLGKQIQSVRHLPFHKEVKVLDIQKINHNYWISTSDGIFVYNSTLTQPIRHFTFSDLGMETNTVFTNIAETKDRVLVSSYRGVFEFSKHGNPQFIQSIEAIGFSYIFHTLMDHDLLWLGTTDGLWKYDFNTKQIKKYPYVEGDSSGASPSFRFISCLEKDKKGNLWLGTFGGGINYFDVSKEQFTAIYEEDGLGNNVVSGVALLDSFLWISHNKGLSSYHTSSGTIKNYDMSDGVVFNEFAISSVFKNNAGQALFGSVKGVTLIDPVLFRSPEKFDSRVILDDFVINYGKTNFAEAYDAQNNLLTLRPKDKTLSIRLTIPDYLNRDISLEYQLVGFDDDWRKMENGIRTVAFSNLDPGAYTLLVRAVNKHHQPSSQTTQLDIFVVTPLWQRWWFLSLVALTILILVVLIARYFSQRKLKEQLIRIEADRKLLHEKQRISKDLHDNVGANITYLIHSLDNISYKIDRNIAAVKSDDLASLSDEARTTMDALRETIWAVNKNKVSILEFKQRLDQFAGKMLGVAGIKYKPEFQFDDQLELSPFLAINILRIIQEAIHNVVKHSDAKEVCIYFEAGNQIKFTLSDDGKGFDPNQNKTGHYGLGNMQDRVQEIGGEMKMDSRPGKGTKIRVEIDL